MRVLITGATGLVGKELVKSCLKKGLEVVFLSTNKTVVEQSHGKGYYWNPASKEIDTRCFEGVNTIFHLAGASVSKRWTKSYKKELWDSRINGIQLLYDSLSSIRHKVSHIVFASGIGKYPSSATTLYQEDFEEKNNSFLGALVEEMEYFADKFQSLSILVTKLRIGIVLSLKGGALPKLMFPVKYGFGAFLGNGKQWQSWIHIQDLTSLFIYVVQHNIEGVVNAVAPHPIPHKQMLQQIANQIKRPLWLPSVPAFFLRFVLGEMADLVLDSQKVSATKIQSLGFSFNFPHFQTALRHLLSSKL